MTVVLNETKLAEEILEKEETGNEPAATLFLLARYYRHRQNLTRKETAGKLDCFMQRCYKNYNPDLWAAMIENISDKALKYPLHEINAIRITESELERIRGIQNTKYQKLLFTMLCYAKLYNTLSENNNGWINTKIKELFRSARITVKYRKDKFLYLNDLEQTGLISFSVRNDNLNIRVNFIDMDSESVLEIQDFRELGYEYMKYMGEGNFTHCSRCHRLILKKSNKDFSTKYCAECAKQAKNEQNRIYYRNRLRKS